MYPTGHVMTHTYSGFNSGTSVEAPGVRFTYSQGVVAWNPSNWSDVGNRRSPRGTQQKRRRGTAAAAHRTGARALRLLALLVLVVAVPVGVWAMQRGDGVGTSLAAFPGEDPGVVHVHGLGVDPADGTLYAATHLGLFRIPDEGAARRVGNRYQDTMGFTTTGPGTFLGSGHPDARENLPPLLGLIESTDGGETWQPRSLLGEADFHALHAAHGKVYGFDSTSSTLMISDDRKKWDRRARLPMRDFAVSPTDADVLVATTDRGVMRSTDGGRRFAPTSVPALSVLAWNSAGELYGVSPTGQVFLSTDGGDSWDRRGQLNGEPEAITVHEGRIYVSLHKDGIYQSENGGRSWTLRYRDA